MKVMISQPMRGKTVEQVQAERAELVKKLEAKGYEVVDTVFGVAPTDGKTALHCLAKSLEVMSECDAVCFMKDWDKARGCRIEHRCAMEYGIKVLEDIRARHS